MDQLFHDSSTLIDVEPRGVADAQASGDDLSRRVAKLKKPEERPFKKNGR